MQFLYKVLVFNTKIYTNKWTFNIPDCGDHIPWQTNESHELVPLGYKDIGKLPNIKGSTISGTNWGAGALSSSAIFSDTTQTYQGGISGGGAASALVSLHFDASKYKAVFNDSYNEVVPSYIIMEYCIKY